MKRFVLFLAALVLTVSAAAQVKITKNEHPVTMVEQISGIAGLMQRDSTFYILTVTDNRYDNGVIIPLGDGVETAIQSVDALLDMFDGLANGETFYIDGEDGERFFVSRSGRSKNASLRTERKAGVCTLHASALQKAKKALEGLR